MTIEGTIKQVMPEKKTASASFKDFLLVTDENYPQTLVFSLKYNNYTQDIFDVIDGYVGNKAKVHFNISGREYQGKHYVQLNAWKVETARKERTSPVRNEPIPAEDDGLPF